MAHELAHDPAVRNPLAVFLTRIRQNEIPLPSRSTVPTEILYRLARNLQGTEDWERDVLREAEDRDVDEGEALAVIARVKSERAA